jgi:hypothetical protein
VSFSFHLLNYLKLAVNPSKPLITPKYPICLFHIQIRDHIINESLNSMLCIDLFSSET